MATQSKRTSKPTSQLRSKSSATDKDQSGERSLRYSQKLLILGMHRSGTSMHAGLVRDLGVQQLGTRPMPSRSDNPDGFFEDVAIQELNDRLLAASGGTWSAPVLTRDRVPDSDSSLSIEIVREGRELIYRYSQDCGAPYFIKDPRISLLAPQWRRVALGEIPTIIALRNPLDVARSLQLRDNIPFRHALALWYAYMDGAARAGVGVPNIIIDYDEAVNRPEHARKVLSQFLSKNLCGHDSEEFVPRQDVQFRPHVLTRRNLEVESSNGEATKDVLDYYRQLRSRHLRSLRVSDANTTLPRWVFEVLDTAQKNQVSTAKLRDLEAVVASLSNQVAVMDVERVRFEGVLGEERAKSEYLFVEAGVLREQAVVEEVEVAAREAELVGLREQRDLLESSVQHLDRQLLFAEAELREQAVVKEAEVAAREAELVGLREQVDVERVRFEGVLGEERAKSEYLFVEAGVLRERAVVKEAEVAAREAELQRLRRQMSALDNEITILAISSLKNQDAATQLGSALIENRTLADCLKWATRDVKRFTDAPIYRISRKARLFAAAAFRFKQKGVGLRNDVIPLDIDPEEFVSCIRISGVTEEEMILRRPDLHDLGINPFTHYVTRGHVENSEID